MYYIWTAADVSRPLADIRRRALRENRAIGLSEVSYSLPQHISLKISFPVPEDTVEAVTEALSAYFRRQEPFSAQVTGIRRRPGLLWVEFVPGEELTRLHRELDSLMAHQFAIPQHPFDTRFRFHSTLFLDPDEEKLARMVQALQAAPLPETVPVRGFLIGGSESGKAGSYRVIRQVQPVK